MKKTITLLVVTWALWAHHLSQSDNMSVKLAVFARKSQCEQTMMREMAQFRAWAAPSFSFKCLPDTIDPRAPTATR